MDFIVMVVETILLNRLSVIGANQY